MKTAALLLMILIFFVIFGFVWGIYFRKREHRLMNSLQKMVDNARFGNLILQNPDETKCSALENSLKQFLDENQLAREGETKQKENIQTLISDLYHQTLTPISNIKIYTELLEEQIPSCEELKTIIEQTEKLDFLIQSLGKICRMENGIISAVIKQNPISCVIDAAINQYQIKAQEKGLSLSTVPTQICAKFDKKWTIEAVGNLLENAIKYTPAGGNITISAQKYQFFARIDVQDTGIGISEEELSKIFLRFYRSLSVSEEPGVGLGLYLVREIIQRQKGYIKVSSIKGKGSVFSIFLPLT